ncbi:DsbA family protein [Patescibacteria group bacterium]
MSENKSSTPFIEKLTPIILVLTVVLAFAVGFLWQKVSNLEKSSVLNLAEDTDLAPAPEEGKLSEDRKKNIPEVTKDDHIFGNRDAEVKIIAYTDLECPFCKRFHETVKEAIEEYDGKVAMVFRHFPLDMLHKQARPEAEASECIAKLGGEEAFNDFIDKIFEETTSNDGLNLTLLSTFASQVGVDTAEFNSCITNRDTQSMVEAQEEGGSKAGVTGTPGSFAINKNGDAWLIPGAVPLETLKAIIDQALE